MKDCIWKPISEAPKGPPGFLATTHDYDCLEWLVEFDDTRFFNINSGNCTDKILWKCWTELPKFPE